MHPSIDVPSPESVPETPTEEYARVLSEARALVIAAAVFCVRSKWLFVPDYPDDGNAYPESRETQFLTGITHALLKEERRIRQEADRVRESR